MRVLTFLHSFAPGGVERDALRLLVALQGAGLEVPVVMGRADGAMATTALGLGLDYRVLDKRGWTAPFETLWMILRLPGQIRRLRPDVLYCAGNTYSIVAVMMRLLMGRACPPIVIKISNDLQRRDMGGLVRAGYHLWVRLQLRWMAGIVAMAPAAVEEIMAVGRVARERITMIRNPCFTQAQMARFERRQPRGEGVRFLNVGRLAAQKNQALLIRAFAAAAGPEDILTIVGEGRLRGALERLAQALGVAERVRMPGHSETPEAAFGAADVFVLSSDFEGLGVVVVEALAAGLPIVATDSTVNMPDLLEGGRLGRLVPVGDEAALAAAMAAAADAVRREDMGDMAARRAKAGDFTVEKALVAQMALFAAAAGQDSP